MQNIREKTRWIKIENNCGELPVKSKSKKCRDEDLISVKMNLDLALFMVTRARYESLDEGRCHTLWYAEDDILCALENIRRCLKKWAIE